MENQAIPLSPREELTIPFRQRAAFLWRYLKAYPTMLALGIACLIGRNGVSFAIPLLIRAGINALTATKAESMTTTGQLALAIAAVAVLSSAFQTVARLNVIGMSRQVEYEMRNDFLKHLFRLDASFWGRTRTGDVMALATNDLNSVRMMLGPGMVSFFESMVQLPVAIVVLAS